jgi:putative ABC transport system substrate-binding protein
VTSRRSFIALSAAFATPCAWPADRPRRIGYMGFGDRPKPGAVPIIDAFFAGLSDLGYEEGHDYVVEWKVTGGLAERHALAARELAASDVDLILCLSTAQAVAARDATGTIPIVFSGVSDPAGTGLVTSLAHPGGNLTGTSSSDDRLGARRLSVLRELLPALASVVVLWNDETLTQRDEVGQVGVAADGTGIVVKPVEMRRFEDVIPAFEQVARLRPDAILTLAQVWQAYHGSELFRSATRLKIPTMGVERYQAVAGALITYGASLADLARRAASYVDRIFKGSRPEELPIEGPTRYELLVNLRTASAIGITVPPSLLQRADDVMQ